MGHYEKHSIGSHKVSTLRINNMNAILRRKVLAKKLVTALKKRGNFFMTFAEMTKLFGKPLIGRDLKHLEAMADELGFTLFFDQDQMEYGIVEDEVYSET